MDLPIPEDFVVAFVVVAAGDIQWILWTQEQFGRKLCHI